MITIENYKVVGWEHAIMGMRNPKNSWHLSDSDFYGTAVTHILDENGKPKEQFVQYDALNIGPNDHKLAMQLVKGGPVHAKFRRMIEVYVDITAPLYWWKEFDTYKVGTVANSCSTMHKIHDKEFTEDDFSVEHLSIEDLMDVWDSDDSIIDSVSPASMMSDVILMLNLCREKYLETKDKTWWWQMIQLLPSSYNQKRTVMFNYETLANIYKWRKNHKLDEWHDVCRWIEELPYSELITGKTGNEDVYSYEFDYGLCPNCAESIGLSGYVRVNEFDSTNDVKLAIANNLENLNFSKLDPDDCDFYDVLGKRIEECEACMIDFGEE